MATTDPRAPGTPSLARANLTARMEERFVAPFKRHPFARAVSIATVIVALGLHSAFLFYLLHKERSDQPKVAEKETSVEVIVEPPPPPPAPEKPADKPEIEKPAMSAPRAENADKTETEQLDAETHAPKAPTPPTDGKPDPAIQAAAPETAPDKPDRDQTESAKQDDPERKAEALDKASLETKPDITPPKTVKPPVKTRAAKSVPQQLAGLSALPDYKFAKPTKKSPVSGGTEDSRYLAIVYGMIMQKFHPNAFVAPTAGSVTVAFEVDGDGQVRGVDIQHSSGDPDFDEAALSAVNHASPLPPPPPGSPRGLIARIAVAEHR